MSRTITRVFCGRPSKAHQIGAVRADTSGPLLSIAIAVADVGGPTGVERVFSISDPSEMGEAWCRNCAKRYPMNPNELLTSGSPKVFLVAEGMWLDPLGVLDRQNREQR